jgi:integrase
MSRRLSALRFAFRSRDMADPTTAARVTRVWEGIRRTHGAPPDQAAPLMPPELLDVLAACPATRTWRTRGRPPEPGLAGARDRALLLVGFVGALRRSELVAMDLEDLAGHDNGLVLSIPRSKTDQEGTEPELVVLPLGPNPARCPVRAVREWTALASISSGPLLRPVYKGNKALARRLDAGALNRLVQAAVTRAGIDPLPYSAHSLRAGFVTYAHLRGATDRAIAHQTRHRSLATLGQYVRAHKAWTTLPPSSGYDFRSEPWSSPSTRLLRDRTRSTIGGSPGYLRGRSRRTPPSSRARDACRCRSPRQSTAIVRGRGELHYPLPLPSHSS